MNKKIRSYDENKVLLEVEVNSLNKRREIELKYNFGLWAAIGLVHYHLASGGYKYSGWILVGYIFAFLLYTLISLKFWHSNEWGHKKISEYKNQMKGHNPPDGRLYWLFKHTVNWHFIYILFTGIILLGSFALLLQKLTLIESHYAWNEFLCKNNFFADSKIWLLAIIYVIIFALFIWVVICEDGFQSKEEENKK